jgi:hypothetical protein
MMHIFGITAAHRIERQAGRALRDPGSSAELFVALEALRTLPGPAGGYAGSGSDQVKALCPVMSRPTMSVWISAVPS